MLPDHSRRHRHHAVGIASPGRLLVESVQEEQTDLVLPHRRLGTTTFDGGSRALGDIVDEFELLRAPFPRRCVVEVQERDDAIGLGDGHVDKSASGYRFERRGAIADARVFLRIGTDDGLAALQILDVGAIVAEVQDPCQAQNARRIPVTDDGDGLGRCVDRAVACTADV